MSVQPGATIGPYTVDREIGRGGMGEVYEAVDTRLDRVIAIKLLRPEVVQDEARRSRFEREAKALAALRHPGIVTIYSIETIDDVTLIATVAMGVLAMFGRLRFPGQKRLSQAKCQKCGRYRIGKVSGKESPPSSPPPPKARGGKAKAAHPLGPQLAAMVFASVTLSRGSFRSGSPSPFSRENARKKTKNKVARQRLALVPVSTPQA